MTPDYRISMVTSAPFECADGCDGAEHQMGYRLKFPMVIPLSDGKTEVRESNYQLCFSCHDFEAITDAGRNGTGTPNTTNYYEGQNLHNLPP